jgi:UDPglucose 6-dehydrogenase/GDP-mannose 6-dehydrogenase
VRVSIIGAGYVGTVTGACLADAGHDVIVVDQEVEKVDAIEAGRAPFFEPGLDEVLARTTGRSLRATTDLDRAVATTELTLVAVGTPSGPTGIDLAAITVAVRAIGETLRSKRDYHTVVVKSTVVPGTTDSVVVPLLEEASQKAPGSAYGVGVNPEFLTEGQAVADFMDPDRHVLGGIDERVRGVLTDLYVPFPATAPRIKTNTRTAEMIKYASNAVLATLISFSNEIADLCEEIGDVDVVEVMRGVHLSQYFSLKSDAGSVLAPITGFLEAGCGFGGSCLPKDVRALIAEGERLGLPVPILHAVLDVNERRAGRLVDVLERGVGDLRGRSVAVLGVAFKPDTDDVRESPAIPVTCELLDRGASVTLFDPVVRTVPDGIDSSAVSVATTLEKAIEGVDGIVLVTRWPAFGRLADILAGLDEPPLVVDGRRMLDKDAIPRYSGIGL